MLSPAEAAALAKKLDGPAHKPPNGTTFNFVNPPNHYSFSLAVLIVCLIVTTSMAFMRMWVKVFYVRKLHLEDKLLPLAFVLAIAHITPGFCIWMFNPIVHQWDMPLRNLIRLLLNLHVGYIFYDAATLVLKVCIMLQFLRLFVPARTHSTTFWITHFLIWLNSLFYFANIFVEIFACKPMEKRWNPLITHGSCVNSLVSHPVSACLNFSLDALLLVWSQKIIWSLHLTKEQRWRVAVPFMAGIMACTCAALRVYTSIRLLNTTDAAYWGTWMGLCTFPEISSGFLVFSLPVLPHFYKGMRKRISSGHESRHHTMLDDRNKTAPRSWFHISQDSMPPDAIGSGNGKRIAITRTDHFMVEFMTAGSTDSILPAAAGPGGSPGSPGSPP